MLPATGSSGRPGSTQAPKPRPLRLPSQNHQAQRGKQHPPEHYWADLENAHPPTIWSSPWSFDYHQSMSLSNHLRYNAPLQRRWPESVSGGFLGFQAQNLILWWHSKFCPKKTGSRRLCQWLLWLKMLLYSINKNLSFTKHFWTTKSLQSTEYLKDFPRSLIIFPQTFYFSSCRLFHLLHQLCDRVSNTSVNNRGEPLSNRLFLDTEIKYIEKLKPSEKGRQFWAPCVYLCLAQMT